MTITVNAASLTGPMNLSSTVLPAASAELLIDLAVDVLNLFGNVEISNMTGTAGTKTLTATSKECGAILLLARMFYYGFFKGSENVTVQGVSVAITDILANPQTVQAIQAIAAKLASRNFKRA